MCFMLHLQVLYLLLAKVQIAHNFAMYVADLDTDPMYLDLCTYTWMCAKLHSVHAPT